MSGNFHRATSWVALFIAFAIAGTSPAADLGGFGTALPEVEFDVPAELTCLEERVAGKRLVTLSLPVSVVVYKGDPDQVHEVVIEIDGSAAGLFVHDYSPATQLVSDYTQPIETKTTTESGKSLDASLGGTLPVPGVSTIAHVTPTIRAGNSHREAKTETLTRLPEKEAIIVSGAINQRRGVYFKLRQSSQTTLEGEHNLSVTFNAPDDWTAGPLKVTCVARGERKWLFVKQRKTWNEQTAAVQLKVAERSNCHKVAKPVADEVAAK